MSLNARDQLDDLDDAMNAYVERNWCHPDNDCWDDCCQSALECLQDAAEAFSKALQNEVVKTIHGFEITRGELAALRRGTAIRKTREWTGRSGRRHRTTLVWDDISSFPRVSDLDLELVVRILP